MVPFKQGVAKANFVCFLRVVGFGPGPVWAEKDNLQGLDLLWEDRLIEVKRPGTQHVAFPAPSDFPIILF